MRTKRRQIRHPVTSDRGFTLIELMATILLMAVLMAIAVFALRHFWFVRSLAGTQDQVVTELRQLQQRTMAESHPISYGAMFTEGAYGMSVVSYDSTRFPSDPAAAQNCRKEAETVDFEGGVRIVDVAGFPTDFDRPGAAIVGACTPLAAATTGDDHFVFFFARGTATPGTVSLEQPNIDRFESVRVSGLAGRVEKL